MDYQTATSLIIHAGEWIAAQGWAPSTSGNYSLKLANGNIAITASGKSKGQLQATDILEVDAQGQSLNDQQPSAETLLHTSLYDLFPTVGAVLHSHSVPVVTLSRYLARQAQNRLCLENYELLKAFPGITSHAHPVEVPLFANDQNMARLSQQVSEQLPTFHPCIGYLIVGHGAYTWGTNMAVARRCLESLETLIICELEALKLP